jgi:2-phospho-L-lactate guanylyltransferase
MKALMVPIKAFHDAKLRLASVMPARERASLARSLATGVLSAAGDLPSFVVCDDHEVAAFAEEHGATVIWTPGRGLSGAVTAGVRIVAEQGFDLVVVAHADLLSPDGVATVGEPGQLTLVPDRWRDGTNVVVVGSGEGFCFSYGRGSFSRHVAEGARLGLDTVVLDDPALALDVDAPADLALIAP